MAPPGDLRDWIARLERDGELVRVTAEVDPEQEAEPERARYSAPFTVREPPVRE